MLHSVKNIFLISVLEHAYENLKVVESSGEATCNCIENGSISLFFNLGKSLLWVGVLGMVIFYLYAIVAFALFRDVFDPQQHLYCDSLLQCTVTMVRYGLIGDYDEVSGENTEFSVYGREKWDFLCLWEGKVGFSLFMGGKSVIFSVYVRKKCDFLCLWEGKV